MLKKKVEHWDSQHDKDKAALTVAWQSSNSYYKVVGRLLFFFFCTFECSLLNKTTHKYSGWDSQHVLIFFCGNSLLFFLFVFNLVKFLIFLIRGISMILVRWQRIWFASIAYAHLYSREFTLIICKLFLAWILLKVKFV